ncbi:MAG: 50S ribosome-binding GTPase [Candidatus Iainarchaeum archaeon]|uniref:50S ribosome-binding GTPase n=1 Tax=Candidatus Iainarchaeum sp. TaxID=3101447 RepID=A0A7T9DKB8_9ARCH|nr:MAG: 50S ribosome-binding GTPase [Candidatus Diapherotrites archaeon]
MQFYHLQKPKQLIETAFDHARKNAHIKRTRASDIQHRKAKVINRMEYFAAYLDKQLDMMIRSVPRFDELHPFYQELLPETLEVGKVKRAVSQLVSVQKLIKKQVYLVRRNMHSPSTDAIASSKRASAAFFGRVSSMVESLEENIELLQQANQLLKEVPDIKTDMPTVVLAGFPNTGKTTILARLTGSKAKIAAYPFTTKSLQLGYFMHRYHEIQVMDTPGLLDREKEDYNNIEKKALAALRNLANLLVFVVDPTPAAGYTLQEQHKLYEKVRARFTVPVMVVFNKCDLAKEDQIEQAQKVFGKEAMLEGQGMSTTLKEEIASKVGIKR